VTFLHKQISTCNSDAFLGNQRYVVSGSKQRRKPPTLHYKISALQLTEDDKHRLQLDSTYVPSPRFHAGFSSDFSLPIEAQIL
jgi:hypothetical protein